MARRLTICSRCLINRNLALVLPSTRTFSAQASLREDVHVQQETSPPPPPPRTILDPARVASISEEARLLKHQRLVPLGSRRRRHAISSTANIPFTQLPYQCFQEARKVLAEDRAEKIQQIDTQRARIARLVEQDPVVSGSEANKVRRLDSMRRELERLKIMADINDPVVKMRFEDGQGDMNKPIYRFLADKKWRSYKRLVTMQRITQMNVIPDLLPTIDPVAEVELRFDSRTIPPGDFVTSTRSEKSPGLKIQCFDKGEKLVTIVAVDADVPDVDKDGFTTRCHGIWTNVPISPTKTTIDMRALGRDMTVLSWLPPFAQQGSPYHRLALFVFTQPKNAPLPTEAIREKSVRENFNMRSFLMHQKVKPIGVTMFRCKWDEGTRDVMDRAGIAGADVVFKREKPLKLPEKYRRKDGARYRGFR